MGTHDTLRRCIVAWRHQLTVRGPYHGAGYLLPIMYLPVRYLVRLSKERERISESLIGCYQNTAVGGNYKEIIIKYACNAYVCVKRGAGVKSVTNATHLPEGKPWW